MTMIVVANSMNLLQAMRSVMNVLALANARNAIEKPLIKKTNIKY